MDFPQFKQVFNKPGIELLPHRDPFLFVDELISADETGGLGRYTFTDPSTAIPGKAVNTFFEGHFPSHPVVPGVVLIEAMAQVAGASTVARKVTGEEVPLFFLAHVDEVRFRRQVRPGDTLVTVATVQKLRSPLAVFGLKGYVGDELACEAVVKCMLGAPKAK